jgi:hypothetical protein
MSILFTALALIATGQAATPAAPTARTAVRSQANETSVATRRDDRATAARRG